MRNVASKVQTIFVIKKHHVFLLFLLCCNLILNHTFSLAPEQFEFSILGLKKTFILESFYHTPGNFYRNQCCLFFSFRWMAAALLWRSCFRFFPRKNREDCSRIKAIMAFKIFSGKIRNFLPAGLIDAAHRSRSLIGLVATRSNRRFWAQFRALGRISCRSSLFFTELKLTLMRWKSGATLWSSSVTTHATKSTMFFFSPTEDGCRTPTKR